MRNMHEWRNYCRKSVIKTLKNLIMQYSISLRRDYSMGVSLRLPQSDQEPG